MNIWPLMRSITKGWNGKFPRTKVPLEKLKTKQENAGNLSLWVYQKLLFPVPFYMSTQFSFLHFLLLSCGWNNNVNVAASLTQFWKLQVLIVSLEKLWFITMRQLWILEVDDASKRLRSSFNERGKTCVDESLNSSHAYLVTFNP